MLSDPFFHPEHGRDAGLCHLELVLELIVVEELIGGDQSAI